MGITNKDVLKTVAIDMPNMKSQLETVVIDIGDEILPTTSKNIKGAISELFQNVSNGKNVIASAITDKGVSTSNNDSFLIMAENIRKISSGNGGYRKDRLLLWEDDFDGHTLDETKWNKVVRRGYNPTNLQYYTDREDNIFLENSNLILRARKEKYIGQGSDGAKEYTWTSGSIDTNNLVEFQFGRVDAKIKMKSTQGTFPAFWLLGAKHEVDYASHNYNLGDVWPQCGEIDVMELKGNATNITGGVIGADVNGSSINLSRDDSNTIDFTEYHIYSMEWDENEIRLYVDDVLFSTYTQTSSREEFKKPFYMILNNAVDNLYGNPTVDQIDMCIDWVRVYAPNDNHQIVLDNETLVLQLADKLKLEATFLGTPFDKSLKWQSSDTNIVEVYGGYIYPKSLGSCIVSCSSSSGYRKECKVSVSNAVITDGAYCVLDARDGNNNSNTLSARVGNISTTLLNFDKNTSSGYLNNTLIFDSYDDVLKFNTNTDINASYTLMYCCKLNNLNQVHHCLCQDDVSSAQYYYCFRPNENIWRVYYNNSNNYFNIPIKFDMNYHVYTLTFDNTTKILSAYIDNILVKSEVYDMYAYGNINNSPLKVSFPVYSNYVGINLRAIYIYDKILNIDEIIKNVSYEFNIIRNTQ